MKEAYIYLMAFVQNNMRYMELIFQFQIKNK